MEKTQVGLTYLVESLKNGPDHSLFLRPERLEMWEGLWRDSMWQEPERSLQELTVFPDRQQNNRDTAPTTKRDEFCKQSEGGWKQKLP